MGSSSGLFSALHTSRHGWLSGSNPIARERLEAGADIGISRPGVVLILPPPAPTPGHPVRIGRHVAAPCFKGTSVHFLIAALTRNGFRRERAKS